MLCLRHQHFGDLVGARLGEPEVAIRPVRDPERRAAGGRRRKLGDRAIRGDLSDHAGILLGEPKVAVWSARYLTRTAAGLRQEELGGAAGSIAAPDRVDAGFD